MSTEQPMTNLPPRFEPVCPAHVGDVDVFDPAVHEHWYPTYEFLQDEAPVLRVPGDPDLFFVSRYEHAMHVLRHQEIFAKGVPRFRHDSVRRVFETKGWVRSPPLSCNPPAHRHYRALIDHFFNHEGATRWTDEITALAHRLVDDFVHDGRVEYVAQFALPLPVTMITTILGFPLSDIEQLKAWSEAWVLPFSGQLTEEEEIWVAEQTCEFQNYVHDHAQQRRAAPRDDVISHLVTTEVFDPELGEHRPLEDQEIISTLDHLYIGGNETTTFALTSALWILLREPGLYERVRDDRSLVPTFVEEVLRLESPTQGLIRTVTRDTELGGVAIPAGSSVHIRYAAANRDPRLFPEPDAVDLDRANLRRHMAFSLGEHSCPGSGLSRLEQNLALNVVLDRLPNLRLAADNDYRHQPGFVLRALRELHLNFG